LSGAVAKEGKKVLIVIWDDASWHTSEAVSTEDCAGKDLRPVRA